MVEKREKTKERERHDECVREIAKELQTDKWTVKANIEGKEKPAKIGKFTPDIDATKKGCVRRVCEVLTENDFKGNKQAYIELKNYCDEYDFRLYVVDKDGNRKQIDPRTFGKK
jgi:hypothetical protein